MTMPILSMLLLITVCVTSFTMADVRDEDPSAMLGRRIKRDRPDRPTRPTRPDRPDRPTRPDRPDRPDRPLQECSGKIIEDCLLKCSGNISKDCKRMVVKCSSEVEVICPINARTAKSCSGKSAHERESLLQTNWIVWCRQNGREVISTCSAWVGHGTCAKI
eukprot:GFUD01035930.1.p1 GENE.GFUD01035930.1~~GFUD01035930.1.p1  ORF type:complete len:162 (+),score=38.02 GFUD01035930.1:124-609(+)